MAIISPAQLPLVLKLRSEPIKFEILSTLGHPTVLVELTETQLEQAIRTTGDFIAQYFPNEQKYAYFYTTPLKADYDLPADAYWVQDVKWDPATTRIGDIFGAESFLFCFPKATKLLDKDGSLQDVREWKSEWKVKTPYGSRRINIFKRKSKNTQQARQIVYETGKLVSTINHPILSVNRGWLNNDQFVVGDVLRGITSDRKVTSFLNGGMVESYAVDVPHAQCLFACLEGEPVLVH
jgi:hypothetical protein